MYKKIKFWKFWERPLFNISEYAFKRTHPNTLLLFCHVQDVELVYKYMQEHSLTVTYHLTTGKNEKEYSWHVTAMKFIGMKQLVKKVANKFLKIRIYVNMWNLGQFRENLIFC